MENLLFVCLATLTFVGGIAGFITLLWIKFSPTDVISESLPWNQ